MINVVLKGVDEFLGAHVETLMLPTIAKLYNVSNDEVIFTCMQSMIFHGGVDQTSFHMVVTVECPEDYRDQEEDVAQYILNNSKEFAVHCHVNFIYYSSEEYERIDTDYPLYVSKENEVDMSDDESIFDEGEDEENDEQEVFTGNIFAAFDEKK